MLIIIYIMILMIFNFMIMHFSDDVLETMNCSPIGNEDGLVGY